MPEGGRPGACRRAVEVLVSGIPWVCPVCLGVAAESSLWQTSNNAKNPVSVMPDKCDICWVALTNASTLLVCQTVVPSATHWLVLFIMKRVGYNATNAANTYSLKLPTCFRVQILPSASNATVHMSIQTFTAATLDSVCKTKKEGDATSDPVVLWLV